MKNFLFILVSIIALAFTSSAQTGSAIRTSLQLGDQVVVLPAPDGFEEAASQFEEIKKRMTATEDPANDMLAVHLPKSVCEQLRKGETSAFSFYTKVSVRRDNRIAIYTESAFSNLVAEFRKNGASIFDINSPALKATVERLDKTMRELNNNEAKIGMSQPVNLGEVDTRPNVYSIVLLINVTNEENGTQRTRPILGGLTFMRVKERLLYVYTYRSYTSKTDIEVLQAFTKKWIGQILAAN